MFHGLSYGAILNGPWPVWWISSICVKLLVRLCTCMHRTPRRVDFVEWEREHTLHVRIFIAPLQYTGER